jgi:hypothetical protein
VYENFRKKKIVLHHIDNMGFSFQPGKFKPVIEVVIEDDSQISDPVTLIADSVGETSEVSPSSHPAPSCSDSLPKSSVALLRETFRSTEDDLLVMGPLEAIPARSSDFFACPCFRITHGNSLPPDTLRAFEHISVPHGCQTCFWCSAPRIQNKYLARTRKTPGSLEVYKFRDYVKFQLGAPTSPVKFIVSSSRVGPDPCAMDVSTYALSGLGPFKIWCRIPRTVLPWTQVLANGLVTTVLRNSGKIPHSVGIIPDPSLSDSPQPLSL